MSYREIGRGSLLVGNIDGSLHDSKKKKNAISRSTQENRNETRTNRKMK